MLINFINTYIFGPALPLVLFASGAFISCRLKFFHILKPHTMLKGIFRRSEGRTSPAKALSLALAGTLGVGNIAGVAGAISLGGAGAIFWMWLSAVISMVLKYSEIMLAVKYRSTVTENGKRRYTGGAFMYMDAHGNSLLAMIFALLCAVTSITMGSIVQANAISVSLKSTFGISPTAVGVIASLLTFLVISGGFSKIADITVLIVPFLCAAYTAVSLYIILSNISLMPKVFEKIFSEAFSFSSAGAGVMSYAFVRAVRYGVARGILSNEAGSGTSPTAHAGSDTDSPCEQGFFGVAEVFIDTILLCSLTAFVILLSDVTPSGDAMILAMSSFEHFLGGAARIFISLSVVFFAFATIICWSVYGAEALRYLSSGRSGRILMIYRSVYSLSVLLGMVIPSAFMWELSDLSVAIMTVINSGYLVYLSKEVSLDTHEYFIKHKG